jgi:tape measure domain-containing protein
MNNQQTVEFLFKAVADTVGLDKFSGAIKNLANAVGASDDALAELGNAALAAGRNLKVSENALGAQINLLKQLRSDATIASDAYRQLGIQANSLARLQKLAQSGLGGPGGSTERARQIAMENTAETLKDVRQELTILNATGDKSRNSLQQQAAAWTKIRNAVDPASDAFKQANRELSVLNRQLEKTSFENMGGRRRGRFELGQTAGVLAGASIYGGPLGFLGGAAGAAYGPGGALIGAQIGAQVGMTTQSLGNMADYAAQIEKLRIGLKEVTANQWEYNRALEIAGQATKNLNVPQEVAVKNVTQLSAAILGSGGNLKDVEDVYIGVSSAVKALGGSAEQVDGALLALIQTFSKGRVSAEELNQLAERLPGAFVKFQQATGKGIKDLELGTVGLKDTMKFVRLLRDEYEQTAKTIGASQQDAGARLQVQINDLRETVGRELGPIGADFQKALADAIPAARDLLIAMKPVAEALVEMTKFAIRFGTAIASMPGAFKEALLSVIPFAAQIRELMKLIRGTEKPTKAAAKASGSDRESNLPDPKPNDANNKAAEDAAKRQRDLAYQLFDLRNELNKRLYENEIDYAKRVTDLNKQAIEDTAKLRRDVQERAQRYLRDNADELVGLQRQGEDLQAQRALQERIAALRAQGANADRAILEDEEQLIRTDFELAKKDRDLNRTEADRQRDATRKLEEFKLEVAKAAGEIQRKYGEAYGKMQEAYAENNAKILQAGAENAAKAIETAARNAAAALSNVNLGGDASVAASGGSGPGAMTPLLKKFADIIYGVESANDKNGGYNSFNLGGRAGGTVAIGSGVNPNLSKNTVQSIMERQSQVGGLHAVGRYQIIGSTMKGLMSGAYGQTGVKPSDRFDAATQDKLFQALLKKRIQPYLDGKASADEAVKQLRYEWVGLREVGTATIKSWLAEFKAAGAPKGQVANILPGTKGGPNWNEGVGYGRGRLHAGQDLGADPNDPVAARANGIVNGLIGKFGKVGGAVVIRYEDGNEGVYGHVNPMVKAGQRVSAGQKIGTVTNDGGNTHLHYELYDKLGKLLDPTTVLKVSLATPAGAAIPNPAAGVPSPAAIYNPKPLPGRLDPSKFAVDISTEERQIRASNAANDAQAAENNALTRANDLKRVYDEQKAKIDEIVGIRQEALKTGQMEYENEIKRFNLMRDGVTPELAEQFIEIDRAAEAESKRLAALRDQYTARASNQSLAEDERATFAQLAASAQQQLNAQQGITTQLRNQAVAAQQLKENPTAIVQERLSFLQEDERKLMNLGNQAVFVANSIGDSFGQAFEGVVTGTKTAQEALAGMFESIAADFAKMAAQILANQLQQSILKGLTGLFGGGGGVLGGVLGSSSGNAFTANGIQKFAKGGIVDSPTLFRFGKGGSMKAGVAGEAGPEAILPLSRGAGGKLGVRLEVPKRPSGGRSASSAVTEAEAMATSKPIKVQVESTVINSTEYVTRDQFETGMRSAVGQAQQQTAKSMRTSLRYRRSAGLG